MSDDYTRRPEVVDGIIRAAREGRLDDVQRIADEARRVTNIALQVDAALGLIERMGESLPFPGEPDQGLVHDIVELRQILKRANEAVFPLLTGEPATEGER